MVSREALSTLLGSCSHACSMRFVSCVAACEVCQLATRQQAYPRSALLGARAAAAVLLVGRHFQSPAWGVRVAERHHSAASGASSEAPRQHFLRVLRGVCAALWCWVLGLLSWGCGGWLVAGAGLCGIVERTPTRKHAKIKPQPQGVGVWLFSSLSPHHNTNHTSSINHPFLTTTSTHQHTLFSIPSPFVCPQPPDRAS